MPGRWFASLRLSRRGAPRLLLVLLTLMAWWAAPVPAAAQAFSSGSSGEHGSFPPAPLPDGTSYLLWNMSSGLLRYCSAYDIVKRPDTCTTELGTAQIPGIPTGGLTTGVFQFVNFDLAVASGAGYTHVFLVNDALNSPLTILSQHNIHLKFIQIHEEGVDGASTASGLQPSVSLPGGKPGPGGFQGGASGFAGTTATDGSPGFGAAGGPGGLAVGPYCQYFAGSNATVTPASTTLAQIIGGSGGGGGASTTSCALGHNNGGSGGGGAGALLMAATDQIFFENSYLYLIGGNGGSSACGCYEGGGGAGGSLKLVAPKLIGSGGVDLHGGYGPRIGYAAGGVIRVEGDATQFNIGITAQSSGTVAATPGALTPPATPALRITQVGTLTVPAAPTGNTATPDVSFPTPPSGPVTVSITASNIPVGTMVKIRVTPQVGAFTEVNSDPLSGTTATSTTTAQVTIPAGYGAITATTSFACDGTICALLPREQRDRAHVEVVASASGSRAFIVTDEGRRIALGN